MSGSERWEDRLTRDLEPILHERDPRPRLSAYHDMPFAIFRYDPRDEFKLRSRVGLLATRLEVAGKRVTRISLASLLDECLAAAGVSFADLADAELSVGLEQTTQTVQEIVSREHPLDEAIATRIPVDADPTRDIVFLTRAGALYGLYRTSAILDRLHGGSVCRLSCSIPERLTARPVCVSWGFSIPSTTTVQRSSELMS